MYDTRAIGDRLLARGETVFVVETSAGGEIIRALLAVPGASRWVVGGVTPYSAQARRALLAIDSFGPDGAVSESAAIQLALAARARVGATWTIAETGIASPLVGRRSRKASGQTVVAVAGPSHVITRTVHADPHADRLSVMAAFAHGALALLEDCLQGSTILGE